MTARRCVELAARGLTADFSSLYRAVEALVGDGELRRVELGTSGSRFERAADHHEHLRCERCGAVAGVSGCVVEQAVPAVERLTGFAVTGHEILFRGLCPDCAASGGADGPRAGLGFAHLLLDDARRPDRAAVAEPDRRADGAGGRRGPRRGAVRPPPRGRRARPGPRDVGADPDRRGAGRLPHLPRASG